MSAAKDRETRRLELQAELDRARSAAERNAAGQFATPPALATEIVRVALAFRRGARQGLRFLEPALGSGAFFSALLREVGAGRIKSAHGIELDERFVQAARSLWKGTGLTIEPGDFTRRHPPARPEARANLLVANPPYVRHHHLGSEDKQRLKAAAEAVLGAPMSGLAGLYVYFLLLSHRWLAPGAISAWLLPSEWMDVNYGAALRLYLGRRVTTLRVHRFDASDVQFGDALVSSSVVFFRNAPPAPGSMCQLTRGSSLRQPTHSVPVAGSELAPGRKWSQLFSAKARASTVAAGLLEKRVLLGDLLQVKRGIATGSNGFFIRPRAEFLGLGIPARFLRPVLPSSRAITSEVIERGKDGYPAVETPLALLDCALPEERIRKKHPALWAYLDSPVGQQVRTGYLTSKRKPWYAQEQRAPSPFIATYMGRGRAGAPPFRFFWNRSDAIATNVYLLLIPREPLAKVLTRIPEAARTLLSFLRQVGADELVSLGRVYGGGLHKLEPKELANLDATPLARSLEWALRGEGVQRELELE